MNFPKFKKKTKTFLHSLLLSNKVLKGRIHNKCSIYERTTLVDSASKRLWTNRASHVLANTNKAAPCYHEEPGCPTSSMRGSLLPRPSSSQLPDLILTPTCALFPSHTADPRRERIPQLPLRRPGETRLPHLHPQLHDAARV